VSTASGIATARSAFSIYPDPTTPVAIIRNEELILIRAEAEWGKGDLVAATADLNIVRVASGGLAPVAGLTMTTFVDELLYERRYSLLFEGHRWIDVRRFDRLNDLPLDKPDFVRNVRFPLPLNECNARGPSEPACSKGST